MGSSVLLLLLFLVGIFLHLLLLRNAVSLAVYFAATRGFGAVSRKLLLLFLPPSADSNLHEPQKAAIKSRCCIFRRQNIIAQLLFLSCLPTLSFSLSYLPNSSVPPSATHQEPRTSRRSEVSASVATLCFPAASVAATSPTPASSSPATPKAFLPVAPAASLRNYPRRVACLAVAAPCGALLRANRAAAGNNSLHLASPCAADAASAHCVALFSLRRWPPAAAGAGAAPAFNLHHFAAAAAANNARASPSTVNQALVPLLLPSRLLSAFLSSEKHQQQQQQDGRGESAAVASLTRTPQDRQQATRPRRQQQTKERHDLRTKQQELWQLEEQQQQQKLSRQPPQKIGEALAAALQSRPGRSTGPLAALSFPVAASIRASATSRRPGSGAAAAAALPSASSPAAGTAFPPPVAAYTHLFAAAAAASSSSAAAPPRRSGVQQPVAVRAFQAARPSLRLVNLCSHYTPAATFLSRLPSLFILQHPRSPIDSQKQRQQRLQQRFHYYCNQQLPCNGQQQQIQQQHSCRCNLLQQQQQQPWWCLSTVQQQQQQQPRRQEDFVYAKHRLSAAAGVSDCRAATAATATSQSTAEGSEAADGGEQGQQSSSYFACQLEKVKPPAALPIVYTPLLIPGSFPAGHTLQPQKSALLFVALQSSAASAAPPAADSAGPPPLPAVVTPANSSSLAAAAHAHLAAAAPSGPAPAGTAAAPGLPSPSSAARPSLSSASTPSTTSASSGVASSPSAAVGAASFPSASSSSSTTPSRSLAATSSSSLLSAATESSSPSAAAAAPFSSSPAAPAASSTAGAAGRGCAASSPSLSPLYADTAAAAGNHWRRQLGHRFTLFSPIVDEQAVLTWLHHVHAPAYVRSAAAGKLSEQQQRKVGLPVSSAFLRKSLAEVSCTVLAGALAAEVGLACVVGGGTHHAKYAEGGKYCLFNDVAAAAAVALQQGRARKVLVLDLDVHQGDGTADIFRNDPRVTTVSVHCEDNFPFNKEVSDVDVPLPAGVGDAEYLRLIDSLLPRLLREVQPSLIFYIAGVDVHADDLLGKLLLSDAGLQHRDALVLQHCLNYNQQVAAALRCSNSRSNNTTSDSSDSRSSWSSSSRRRSSSSSSDSSTNSSSSSSSCIAQGDSSLGSRVGVCCVIGGGYSANIQDVVHRHSVIFNVASHFWSNKNFSGVYASAALHLGPTEESHELQFVE